MRSVLRSGTATAILAVARRILRYVRSLVDRGALSTTGPGEQLNDSARQSASTVNPSTGTVVTGNVATDVCLEWVSNEGACSDEPVLDLADRVSYAGDIEAVRLSVVKALREEECSDDDPNQSVALSV